MKKPKIEAPKKLGRPSSFNEKLAMRILDLASSRNMTDEQIAKAIGVSVATLGNWKANHPDFLEALKKAKNVADQLVMASLFQRACGYSHKAIKFFCHEGVILSEEYDQHYPPDVTACIFWLKNRQPKKWRDVHKQADGADETSKPIGVAYVPKSQRKNEGAA